MLFLRYYTENNKFGFQNKVSFTLYFKEWKDSKSVFSTGVAVTNEIVTNDLTKSDTAKIPMNDLIKLAKEPQNYNREVNKFEEKPIDVDNEKFVLSKKTTPIKKNTLNLKEKVHFNAQTQFREEKKKMLELKLQKNTEEFKNLADFKKKLNR